MSATYADSRRQQWERQPRGRWDRTESSSASHGPRRSTWGEHRAYLVERWDLGDHVSILAPTSGGKTHLIVRGLLPLLDNPAEPKRAERVLFLDAKRSDPLTAGVGQLVDEIPPGWRRRGKPWYRLNIPSLFTGVSKSEQQSKVFKALQTAFLEGNWTIVVDELRPLINLRLTDYLVDIWERGRTEEVTLIAGTQAPRLMPGHFYDQPTHAYLGRVTDKRTQFRLREIGGFSHELGEAIATLGRRQFAYVSGPFERQEVIKVTRSGRA